MSSINLWINNKLKRSNFLLIFLLLVFTATAGLFFADQVRAALTCSVAATCADVTLLKMQATANAHAGLPASSAYANLVCCADAAAGLSNNCAGTYALVGTLSGANNAHYEDWTKTNYLSANDFCLSVTSGTISVSTSTNCGANATIFSISGASGTNAHVGTSTAYTTKVCGTTAGASLTFTVTTNNFPTLTPGAPVFATSTLNVNTNNTSGWNVTLSGNNVTLTAQTMNDGAGAEITDKDPQWIIAAAAATTTAGNATTITNGSDALAFRVMSASSTNAVSFLSTAWWGTSDAMFNAAQLWAGIASSTNASRIGNAGAGSLSASDHLNTVQYYLDVPASQKTGTYTGTITYTATANP